MTNKIAKRRRKWRPRPYLSRRQKIGGTIAFLAVAAVLLPLGLIHWWEFAAIAVMEACFVLLIPTKENREGIKEAAAIGVIDDRHAQALEAGDTEDDR